MSPNIALRKAIQLIPWLSGAINTFTPPLRVAGDVGDIRRYSTTVSASEQSVFAAFAGFLCLDHVQLEKSVNEIDGNL